MLASSAKYVLWSFIITISTSMSVDIPKDSELKLASVLMMCSRDYMLDRQTISELPVNGYTPKDAKTLRNLLKEMGNESMEITIMTINRTGRHRYEAVYKKGDETCEMSWKNKEKTIEILKEPLCGRDESHPSTESPLWRFEYEFAPNDFE